MLSRGFAPATIAMISGPVYVVGALFIADWSYRRRFRVTPS
jgi:hypothetical protein